MKLIRIFTIAVLLTGTVHAFAKTNLNTITINKETEDRHLTGFKAVSVSGSFDVYIVQGATESVRVEAPSDVIRHIVTEVKNGTLNIYTKDHFSWNNLFGNKKMAVYVSIREINAIDLTGSGDVFFKEGLNANFFRLRLTGSGDIIGKLTAKSLDGSLTGSGDIKISGSTDNLKVTVTGSGDFSARGLAAVNTVAHVGGSGDANVNASGSLEASVTGSGDVRYGGNPKNITKSKTGSGDISRF